MILLMLLALVVKRISLLQLLQSNLALHFTSMTVVLILIKTTDTMIIRTTLNRTSKVNSHVVALLFSFISLFLLFFTFLSLINGCIIWFHFFNNQKIDNFFRGNFYIYQLNRKQIPLDFITLIFCGWLVFFINIIPIWH